MFLFVLFGYLYGRVINSSFGHHVVIEPSHLFNMRLIKLKFMIIEYSVTEDLFIILFHPISIVDKWCSHK